MRETIDTELPRRRVRMRRAALLLAAAVLAGLLVLQAADSRGGVPDPTAAGSRLSPGAVVVDAGLLVFREGLEAVLVLAAVTASFRGANRARRRPVAAGSGLGLLATVATWFAAIGVIGVLGGAGLAIQAATGLLAVLVLLVVMNWFFHRIYWTGWISNHHKRRKRLLAETATIGPVSRATVGFVLLGFTAIYREGFEVVLFLQNLRLKAGSGVVLEGVAIGVALTAAVGALTFLAHHRLPSKRMLVLTGVLLGIVLVVMVGESAAEMQAAGWLPTTPIAIAIPGWLGVWFAMFPTVETLAAQLLAAGLVIGSYFLAEHVRVRRPRRAGRESAERAAAARGRPLSTTPQPEGPARR